MTWFDAQGKMHPAPDAVAQEMQEQLKIEQRRTETERQRAEAERQQKERLSARLRELGEDPAQWE